MCTNWNNNINLDHNISNITDKVNDWNKLNFGNSFKRKNRLKAWLNGIQIAQEINFSYCLDCLEKNLKSELKNVLKEEELYWYQQSRVQWLKDGDKNTKFFHLSTIIRRRENKIERLKVYNWVHDHDTVKSHIVEHFKILFKFEPRNFKPIVNYPNVPKLSNFEKDILGFVPTIEEIRRAVFSMNGLKAPGPDGIQPLFYQRFWNIIKNSLCDFVVKYVQNCKFPQDLNISLITLIPKIDNPEFITQFIPIILCNVSYKIVTKILVQRIRPILDKIVGHFQASFLLGRQTSDNIIIIQEILHTLMNKTEKKGGMIFKIDLEKAFDIIN